MDQPAVAKPNIFSYLDYRKFLKDLYSHKKSKSKGFSYRNFSKAAGFKSPNFLKMVTDGIRNLSLEGAYQFAAALKLESHETEFFLQLVRFNQSKTTEEKRQHYEQIMRSGHYRKAKPLERGQYTYFSNWYLVALRELVGIKGFKENWPYINRMLGLNLSAREVSQAIDLLLELGLLKRDKKKRLVQADAQLDTEDKLLDLNFINCHRQMIHRAADSIEKSRAEHRNLSCLTVGLDKRQFDQINREIDLFRARIHHIASQNQEPEAVYQVNFQLFNLSEVPCDWK